MTDRARAWLRRAGAALLVGATLAVLNVAYVAVHAAWNLATAPDFTPEILDRSTLVLQGIGIASSIVLLVITTLAATATWLTVREMRRGREQEASIEASRADARSKGKIRDEGWILIAEAQISLAGMEGVTAALHRAGRLGLVRTSVQGPLLQESFAVYTRATRAVVAAQRLADTEGPWQAAANELGDLILEAMGTVGDDAEALRRYAHQAAEPLRILRESLPKEGIGPGDD